jgi:uncharacterized repeat protein (TIGR03943 family)
VKRGVAGLIIVFVGAAIVQIAASDTHLRYVKPTMRPALLAAGITLVVLAVVDVLADTTRRQHQDDAVDDHGHDHGQGHHLPRAAWLLLLPVFALLVVDPPALGADAAQRQSPVAAKPVAPRRPASLLPAGDPSVPVTLSVRNYAVWSVWQSDGMQHRTFRLTGFVTPGKDGAWYLTRIGLNCCVADGTAFMVEVRDQPAPPKNQWVEVTGRWAEPTEHPDGDIAALTVTAIRPVTAPVNPYE